MNTLWKGDEGEITVPITTSTVKFKARFFFRKKEGESIKNTINQL